MKNTNKIKKEKRNFYEQYELNDELRFWDAVNRILNAN